MSFETRSKFTFEGIATAILEIVFILQIRTPYIFKHEQYIFQLVREVQWTVGKGTTSRVCVCMYEGDFHTQLINYLHTTTTATLIHWQFIVATSHTLAKYMLAYEKWCAAINHWQTLRYSITRFWICLSQQILRNGADCLLFQWLCSLEWHSRVERTKPRITCSFL